MERYISSSMSAELVAMLKWLDLSCMTQEITLKLQDVTSYKDPWCVFWSPIHTSGVKRVWRLRLQVLGGSHQLKPLPEGIAKGFRKGVYISKNDVEWKWKLFHIRYHFWHFFWTCKYWHFYIQDGILKKQNRHLDQSQKKGTSIHVSFKSIIILNQIPNKLIKLPCMKKTMKPDIPS